jgi:4-hydroxyproline epimerase
MAEKREHFRVAFDGYRRAMVCEPRGSDVMVGALLTEPVNSTSVAGVIFFNNVGYLGMCGHGTMGVAAALRYAGKIDCGEYALDTPVGTIQFNSHSGNCVSIENVPSYRYRAGVDVSLASGKVVTGDIAWGGNWFFLCDDHGLEVVGSNLPRLQALAGEIRHSLAESRITGERGEEIDHVELFGPASSPLVADARNFVLCPGGAFDRSPCGTGTSAKIACLAADGKLQAGETFRQQSIVGSVFTGSFDKRTGNSVIPKISGTAFVNAVGQLILDPLDPFCMGIL